MKAKTLVRFASKTVTAILIIVMICIVFLVVASRASGGEPTLFGYQLKTVLSGSMEPGIQTGSIIMIKLVDDTTQFQKGDVITYRDPQQNILITHRVEEVELDGTRYVTKGDNNNAPDQQPVLAENIIGKYNNVTIPYVGYVFQFVNSGEGIVFLLIIPGLLLLGHAVFTLWRAIRTIEVPKESNET